MPACEVALVDQDGAARGPRSFMIYNPPVVDPELGVRRSALQESVRLAQDLLAYHVQTIIFGRSRRSVELILSYLRQSPLGALPSSDPFSVSRRPDRPAPAENAQLVRGYRSGYLPEQRREIERGLRQGDIQAVVATNALELGIDIGGMGAALLVGYPGTIAALRQQAGRAGRGAAASLAVLVATADPIDQFLASHPEYLFERSPEHALINPDNPLILLDHLRCAAFELPFKTRRLVRHASTLPPWRSTWPSCKSKACCTLPASVISGWQTSIPPRPSRCAAPGRTRSSCRCSRMTQQIPQPHLRNRSRSVRSTGPPPTGWCIPTPSICTKPKAFKSRSWTWNRASPACAGWRAITTPSRTARPRWRWWSCRPRSR